MKNFCVRTLFTFVLAGAAFALRAETGLKVIFNAPFSFVAGAKTMPAGSYQLSENDSHLLMIQAVGHPNNAAVIVYGVGVGSTSASGVDFVRHGGLYYLNTVQLGDGRTVRLLGQPTAK